METLERKIQESIKQVEEIFGESEKIAEFEKTSKEFEELVKKGIIVRRGNRLLSASDRHLRDQVVFNAK